jgi:hypothetical protein
LLWFSDKFAVYFVGVAPQQLGGGAVGVLWYFKPVEVNPPILSISSCIASSESTADRNPSHAWSQRVRDSVYHVGYERSAVAV